MSIEAGLGGAIKNASVFLPLSKPFSVPIPAAKIVVVMMMQKICRTHDRAKSNY
jgi:hypothetical protein